MSVFFVFNKTSCFVVIYIFEYLTFVFQGLRYTSMGKRHTNIFYHSDILNFSVFKQFSFLVRELTFFIKNLHQKAMRLWNRMFGVHKYFSVPFFNRRFDQLRAFRKVEKVDNFNLNKEQLLELTLYVVNTYKAYMSSKINTKPKVGTRCRIKIYLWKQPFKDVTQTYKIYLSYPVYQFNNDK